jgi:hypothetical protein
LQTTILHEQFERQNVANSIQNKRFGLQKGANTVEMAASSSKLPQIARKIDRTGNKRKQNGKKTISKQFRTHLSLAAHCSRIIFVLVLLFHSSSFCS